MSIALQQAAQLALPRYRSPSYSEISKGTSLAEFAEQHLTLSKGPRAGQAVNFALWQRWLADELLETWGDGSLVRSRALIGVGRQNGKSIFGSSLALWGLFTGGQGTEVYSAAGDRQQARIVFNEAKKAVEASPTLSPYAKVYRDAIECTENGGVYRALSADARLQQGLSPQLVIFDEVHVQRTDDLWDALTMGTGARIDPLVVGITTAGENPESLAGRLYDYGKKVASGEIDDPEFGFWWWEPYRDDCEITDRDAWHESNPSLHEGITFADDMEMSSRQSTPIAFRRYRLNQWRRLGGSGWMDLTAWDAQKLDSWKPKKGARIVVGFDGSVDTDATALVAIQIASDDSENHVVWPVGIWEPPTNDDTWQVPRDEVDAQVSTLFEDYEVVAMGADPAWWRSELQEWATRFGDEKVLDWPVTNARMAPAVTSTYARIKDGRLWHNGDEVLRRHMSNAVAKDLGGQGVTIQKEKRGSSRKIDAAVATCIAVDMLERYADADEEGGNFYAF